MPNNIDTSPANVAKVLRELSVWIPDDLRARRVIELADAIEGEDGPSPSYLCAWCGIGFEYGQLAQDRKTGDWVCIGCATSSNSETR